MFALSLGSGKVNKTEIIIVNIDIGAAQRGEVEWNCSEQTRPYTIAVTRVLRVERSLLGDEAARAGM